MTLQSFGPDQFDQSRRFLLDRRGERLHPKRHRTQKRAKRLSAKKRQRIKHHIAVRNAENRKYRALVAAYWAGAAEGHP